MKRLLVFVFIGILFQGCISLHNGIIAPNSVDVSTDNFQIIKTIDGKATAEYFLGLGGGGRKGLVKEAKRDMYKNHPPSSNEMITNITVDDKKLFFLGGLYIEHTVFVSADVVRFGEYVKKEDKSPSINSKNIEEEIKEEISEEQLGEIMNGYNKYTNGMSLSRGTKVLFKAGEDYYYGIMKYQINKSGSNKVIDIHKYDFDYKDWILSDKEEVFIPVNIILGYKI